MLSVLTEQKRNSNSRLQLDWDLGVRRSYCCCQVVFQMWELPLNSIIKAISKNYFFMGKAIHLRHIHSSKYTSIWENEPFFPIFHEADWKLSSEILKISWEKVEAYTCLNTTHNMWTYQRNLMIWSILKKSQMKETKNQSTD